MAATWGAAPVADTGFIPGSRYALGPRLVRFVRSDLPRPVRKESWPATFFAWTVSVMRSVADETGFITASSEGRFPDFLTENTTGQLDTLENRNQ